MVSKLLVAAPERTLLAVDADHRLAVDRTGGGLLLGRGELVGDGLGGLGWSGCGVLLGALLELQVDPSGPGQSLFDRLLAALTLDTQPYRLGPEQKDWNEDLGRALPAVGDPAAWTPGAWVPILAQQRLKAVSLRSGSR